MFRNFRKNKNNNWNVKINSNRMQNPQLKKQYFYNQQEKVKSDIQQQMLNQNKGENQQNLHKPNAQFQNSTIINDFSNKEALMKQGIQVLPYNEANKQDIINTSTSNNLKGDVVFATNEFKEKYFKDKDNLKKAEEKHKKETMKKVKFEISDIYKNELNRKYFYSSLASNCDDVFVSNCIHTILNNCNKLFSIYEKERFFKEKIKHTPKSSEVLYNRSMILFAIEEENKMFFSLVNEMKNNWDYSKLNRVLIIKMHDLAILNSILAYIK